MPPYKTRRSVYALYFGLLGLFFFSTGWHWIKTDRELGVADIALGLAQIIMACIIWKRRNRPPPTV